MGPVLGPHARTDRTRDTRVAEPWLPAPEDGRPGEGQRLTPDAPRNGGRPAPPGTPPPPPPRHAAPTGHASQEDSVGPPHHHTRAHNTWVADPNSPPGGRAARGRDSASEVRRCPSPGCPPTGRAVGVRHPRAVGAGVWVWGPNTVPLAYMPCWGCVPRGWWGGRPRGGWPATVVRGVWCQAPHNGGRHPPPGTPFRHPHSEPRRPARAHAVGPVLGPHARTDRTRDKRVAEPRLPAPEDGWSGEGQRLTPEAPHNGGRPPPRGWPPTTPAARSHHRACRPRGQCWAPTPTHPRTQHVGGGPRQPAEWAGSRERDSA